MIESIPDHWIPLLIFIARIFDVSFGTLRVLFVSRGLKIRAGLFGFFEVLIWVLVIAQLIQHLNNWVNYVAYAGGFSVGTYIGITLENKLKVGTLLIRIITHQDASSLIENLKKAGVMITSVDAAGGIDSVKIIFSVIKRKMSKEVVEIIEHFDSEAFYSIEDVKFTSRETSGFSTLVQRSVFDRLLRIRKGV
ncbi:MAG TPA: DUF5698 domain-containing protein [Fodinibius sp.]|nr:DUF5698 domain-containing protein [Fodinibius sp.]